MPHAKEPLNMSQLDTAHGTGSTANPSKKRRLLTIDRIIIYLLLLVFLGLVVNDRRILNRATYLTNVLQDASLANNKVATPTPTLDTLDEADRKELMKVAADQSLLHAWLKDQYGIEPDSELSQSYFDLYRISSGIREYRIKVRFKTGSTKKASGLTDMESYYFWEKPDNVGSQP